MRLSGENAALNPREENWSSSEFLPDKPRQIEKKNCDKYSQCQTLIACQLFEAAQWKDERLLLQIEDKDLVGLEVYYHCHFAIMSMYQILDKAISIG